MPGEPENALELATHLGQSDDQARAHDALAHTYRALGRRELASHHWGQALAILTHLGVNHTDDPQTTTSAIREHLADIELGQQS
jgi:hypothetical protein